MPVAGPVYKEIGRSAAGPVCIVAARDRVSGKVVGLTASSFVTLSFNPPMVMFALQQSADSYSSIVSSQNFGVSLLDRSQKAVAALFARKGPEKFEQTTFSDGPVLKCPLIPNALAHVECLTKEILMSGDHAIVVGLVEGAVTRPGEPLLYFGGEYGTFVPLRIHTAG